MKLVGSHFDKCKKYLLILPYIFLIIPCAVFLSVTLFLAISEDYKTLPICYDREKSGRCLWSYYSTVSEHGDPRTAIFTGNITK
uniref:Uncharacterized protein n=1 Tax=Pyxicephalus adspersus TaxID=30357 RepID=A0AAV3AMZ3_PYXAD|nr:TPA: hypothetical protein GDO54_010646 [Pyxicephalus adspersus]